MPHECLLLSFRGHEPQKEGTNEAGHSRTSDSAMSASVDTLPLSAKARIGDIGSSSISPLNICFY